MTESISYRGSQERLTSASEIAGYMLTGMKHIGDAANLLAHSQEYGSSALLGVDEDNMESVQQDVYWLAHHAHNLNVLAVDHVVGSLHGPATSKTFRHIDEFAFTHGKSGLIVFNDIDTLADNKGKFARAQDVAAKYISRLIAHEARPRICAISSESPSYPQNERLLGVFASYVSFTATAETSKEKVANETTSQSIEYNDMERQLEYA